MSKPLWQDPIHQSSWVVLTRSTTSVYGTAAGAFKQLAPPVDRSGPQFLYNVTIYENTTLPLGRHSLTVDAGKIGGPEVLFFLDAILYDDAPRDLSRNEPSPFPSGVPFPSSASTGRSDPAALSGAALVGLILGPFLGLALGVGTTLFIVRRRRRRGVAFPSSSSSAPRYEAVPGEPHDVLFRRRRSIAHGRTATWRTSCQHYLSAWRNAKSARMKALID